MNLFCLGICLFPYRILKILRGWPRYIQIKFTVILLLYTHSYFVRIKVQYEFNRWESKWSRCGENHPIYPWVNIIPNRNQASGESCRQSSHSDSFPDSLLLLANLSGVISEGHWHLSVSLWVTCKECYNNLFLATVHAPMLRWIFWKILGENLKLYTPITSRQLTWADESCSRGKHWYQNSVEIGRFIMSFAVWLVSFGNKF